MKIQSLGVILLLTVTLGGCTNDKQNSVNTAAKQPVKSSNNDTMQKDAIDQLQVLKAKDKFSEEDWDQRGLIASPEDVREKMNQEVNKFIDFVESRLQDNSGSIKDAIRSYIADWNSDDFDTEEAEYLIDKMCEVMQVVEVDCNEIMN